MANWWTGADIMKDRMILLRIKIIMKKIVERIRRKFHWYEYECSHCKSIYDRMTGDLLDGYGVFGDKEEGYLCKLCEQKDHEKNDKLECPICHKKELYTYDWDFLGEYAHYKCKHCRIVFIGSNVLWNYALIFLNGVNSVVEGLPQIKESIKRLEDEYDESLKEVK